MGYNSLIDSINLNFTNINPCLNFVSRSSDMHEPCTSPSCTGGSLRSLLPCTSRLPASSHRTVYAASLVARLPYGKTDSADSRWQGNVMRRQLGRPAFGVILAYRHLQARLAHLERLEFTEAAPVRQDHVRVGCILPGLLMVTDVYIRLPRPTNSASPYYATSGHSGRPSSPYRYPASCCPQNSRNS